MMIGKRPTYDVYWHMATGWRARRLAMAVSLFFTIAMLYGCAPHYTTKRPIHYKDKGEASWYGPGFSGRKTASGERYNQNSLTAAHRSLPFGTTVRVTALDSGKSVIVRINDRGPYSGGRIIDLSKAAAKEIGMIGTGTAEVELVALATPGIDDRIERMTSKKRGSKKERHVEDDIAAAMETDTKTAEVPYF